MHLSSRGLSLMRSFEALKLEAYQDQHGVWTIGWGHTAGVKEGETCTAEQAGDWQQQDVLTAENAVNRYVDVALNQNQFDALVDFTYNLGAGSLQGSTLLHLLNQHLYSAAALEFPKWNHCGGVEDPGLTRRRAAEQELFNEPA